MGRSLDPELMAEAHRWRRVKSVGLVLAAVIGGSPVVGFAVATAAVLAAAR